MLDVQSEVALNADYDTTLKILELHPKYNTLTFWKNKCTKLYPSKTYLDFFTPAENFLLKERSFFLLGDDECDLRISNILFDSEQNVKDLCKIFGDLSNRVYDFIEIKIDKQFILIKRDCHDQLFQLFGYDIKDDCVEIIKRDTLIETYDCDYYIIDTKDLKLRHKNLTDINPTTIEYDYHSGSKYNPNL